MPSATLPWDDSDRPSAPTESRQTSRYTQAGRLASAALVHAHDVLREELDTLRNLIIELRNGELAVDQARSALREMTMRQANWTTGAYCETYCWRLTRHHTQEDDSVFPHLRAHEPALGPVLDRLSEEHTTIHGVLDAVDRALVGLVAGATSTSRLQEIVDLLSEALLSHLTYEERELIDPLSRHGFY